MTTHGDALEGLLELCDQIRDLQERSLRGAAHSTMPEHTLAAVKTLRQDIFDYLPSLAKAPGASDLSDSELLLLALLFNRRLQGQPEAVTGGELTALLCRAGYKRTQVMDHLRSASELRSKGWLKVQADPNGFDPLDTLFAASPAGLSLFWPKERKTTEILAGSRAITPYAAEEDCLWDLYAWRILCMHRAEALLEGDHFGQEPSQRLLTLQAESRSAMLYMRSRLRCTPQAESYSLEQFRRRFRLHQDEWLTVVHLLFSDLLEGEPYISSMECLRVMAVTRIDMFRKRRVLTTDGKLRRSGIVHVHEEHVDYNKSFAVDLGLADWATEDLLKGIKKLPPLEQNSLNELLQGDAFSAEEHHGS